MANRSDDQRKAMFANMSNPRSKRKSKGLKRPKTIKSISKTGKVVMRRAVYRIYPINKDSTSSIERVNHRLGNRYSVYQDLSDPPRGVYREGIYRGGTMAYFKNKKDATAFIEQLNVTKSR